MRCKYDEWSKMSVCKRRFGPHAYAFTDRPAPARLAASLLVVHMARQYRLQHTLLLRYIITMLTVLESFCIDDSRYLIWTCRAVSSMTNGFPIILIVYGSFGV